LYRSARNGKVNGRNQRRVVQHLWNINLAEALAEAQATSSPLSSSSSSKDPNEASDSNAYDKQRSYGVFMLRYEEELREASESSPVGYVLKKVLNADGTHMNSGFLKYLEKAIGKCGCDVNLL
jgi:ribosomal protein L12E/L44/L45/RPP1/RPP2